MKTLVKSFKQDRRLIYLAIIGILFIIGGIFTAFYSETTFKLGKLEVQNKPYTEWTPPLVVAGFVVIGLTIYLALDSR